MNIFLKILTIFLFSIQSLIGGYVVTTSKSGGNTVSGYFNGDNQITITMTHSNNEAERTYRIRMGLKSSSGVSNYSVDMQSYGGPVRAVAQGGAYTWTITAANVAAAVLGTDPSGKYIDFEVYHDDSNKYAVSYESGQNVAELIFDNDDPEIINETNSSVYPLYLSEGFNTVKVTYYLSETVTTASYMRFDNQANSTNHDKNLSGDGLNTGGYKTLTGFSSLAENNEYKVCAYLTDVAGNTGTDCFENWRNNDKWTYDTTAPRINSVTGLSNDGTYIKDQSINLRMTFSEKVYSSGTINVTFETGSGTDRVENIAAFGLAYNNASQYSTRDFTFTVQNGNESDDLAVHASTNIAMGSGKIYDIAQNEVSNYALAVENLDANSNYVIDGKPPTITSITSTTSDNTYGIGKEINVRTTFSEPVYTTGDYKVTLETGGSDGTATTAGWDSGNPTNVVNGIYTIASPEASGDLLAASATMVAGKLKDVAGNEIADWAIGTNINAASDIIVETTLPTIKQIKSSTNDGTYGIDDQIVIQVEFTEAVDLTGGNISVPLETGDNDKTVAILPFSNNTTGAITYTVEENHTTNGQKLSVKADPGITSAGTIKDNPAGNVLASLAIPGSKNLDDTKNIIIDAKRPTITNATSSDNDDTYKIGDNIEIKLEFDEKMTLANGTLDLSMNHGSATKVEVAAFSEKTSATKDYTVVEGDTTNDLNIVSMALSTNATLKDLGGNAPAQLVPTTTLEANKAIKVDGNRPAVMKISSTSPAGYYKVGSTIPIVLYFTEAVNTTAANIITGTLETGSVNADATVVFPAVSNGTSVTKDYVVRENDFNSSLTMNTIAVAGGQRVNDLAGNEMQNAQKAIPSGKNLADQVVDIFVDGVLPVDDGTAITMTTKGGNVVANKYNDTNTSVDFVVTIQNSDATLIGGTVQIQAKIAPNAWATIGDSKTISSADKTAGKVTVNVLSAPIEALNGFATDGVIKIKATVTDKAGNSKDWAESSNTLTIDVTIPTILSATSTTNTGTYKATDGINITLGFSEKVKMFNDELDITLNTSHVLNIAANDIDEVSTESNTYTIAAGEQTPDIAGSSSATLAVSSVSTQSGELRDLAGNPMVLPVTVIATKIADSKAISVDGVAPTALTADTVIATGNTVRHGYWNGVNTGVEVHIPLTKADNTLLGGKVKVKAKLSNSGTWSYVGEWSTITSAELNAGNKVMTLTKAHIDNPFLQSEGNIIEFTAGVQDKAGNETEWSKSSQTLFVDTVKPSQQQVTATVTSVGGNVIANYWNSTNSSVSVKIDFPTDASLENGEVLLITSENGSAYTDFGDTTKITSGIYSAKTVTVSADSVISGDKLGLEEVNWFSEGDELRFGAKVLDRAGNQIDYTASNTTLRVKQALPTVTSVTSTNNNKAYKAGQDLTIQVVMSEVVNVNTGGIPRLTLETGGTDAVATYASGSTSNTLAFTYSIVTPHTSDDLNYFSKNALSVAGNNHVRDDYGNPIDPTLPDLDSNNSLIKNKDLVIDTTPPSVRFTYDDADSLVRKETGTLVITATFSDSIQADLTPTISVDFPTKGTIVTPGVNGTATTGDVTDQNMTEKSGQAGKVYTYNLSLVDNSDGKILVTVAAQDKALNSIVADSTFDGEIVTIDNLDPVLLQTGAVTMFGDTVSSYWFNKSTDSLGTTIPIDQTDNSLLRGNIQVQMRVDGKMASNAWETILPKDNLLALTSTVSKYRTKKEILDILTPKNLAQGDKVFVRALLNDQVGNITEFTESNSFFVLDTIPPAVGVFADVAFVPDTTLKNKAGIATFLTTLRDTLWTNDTLAVGVRNWTDPKNKPTDVGVSGIQRYEYSVEQSDGKGDAAKNGSYSLFRSYKFQEDLLDTVILAIDSLEHDYNYKVRIQAFDVAGNQSANILSNSILRYNAKPNGEDISDVIAKEDILWEKRWKLTDKDLSIKDSDNKHIGGTLLSDQFTYNLTTFKIDQPNTGDTTAVTPNGPAEVNASGEISFTPTKLDTADFLFRVLVTDNWGLKDQIDFKITVLPVNDAPILNLDPLINTWGAKKLLTFDEGDSSAHMNITRYASDEDNDTTDLKYSFKIASKIPTNIGYPIAKIGFLSNFGNEYKKSFINQLVDEFPASTIIQKNNNFLIYSANVEQFKDPIKVDSLSTKGVKDKSIDSLYTWITPTDTTSADTNYYTESEMMVEFSVIDPEGLIGKDTINFLINPKNDKPVWAGIRDTIVKENDSLLLDFANYLTDVDDSTLTITISPLSFQSNVTLDSSKMSAPAAKTFTRIKTAYQFQSQARKDTVKIKPQPLWFDYENGKPRKGLWNPSDTLSNQIKFEITAADDEGASAIDTFVVKVQRVPRPEIRMYVVQNNAFTNYYEVFLVDSLGKTKDLTLEVQSIPVTLDTAAAFTYVGHYNFPTKGNYTFDVKANGLVGDTSIVSNVGLTLAKMYGNWSGKSADGQFQVIGKNGSVDFDQSVIILDSTLFEPYFTDRASYLLGNESFRFKKSVEISLPGEEGMAIYSRSIGSGWIELPSMNEGNRVIAYTEKMGYFRLGPKTLIVPGQTSLHQNYPNPFNPSTTIDYDLGFIDGPYQKVNIAVYDILGRKIKLLVNEEKSIGRYQVKWDGKDHNGVPVSSGIYFINLLTDMGRIQTKKVMLMR